MSPSKLTARMPPVTSCALTRRSIETIPATAETEDTVSYEGGAWLPFLDTYRTMCLAPQPDFRRVLEDVRAMQLAAQKAAKDRIVSPHDVIAAAPDDSDTKRYPANNRFGSKYRSASPS